MAGLVTLQIADLPRSGPRRLEAGREAMHAAYQRTRFALRQPVRDGAVEV
jgi:hypothetical protein